MMLYLIEILHQTTTLLRPLYTFLRCILLKFYIKPQHPSLGKGLSHRCILLKFYIKPQLCLINIFHLRCCILLKFYIKPQL